MSDVDLLDPCHTCDFVARLYRAITSQHATAQLHVATLLCQTNQASITDYDIHANSLVLVGCLAKIKRTMNRRVKKRLDTEPICHFGTVFVKEDHETGKVVQKPCFFYATKLRHATQQSQHLQLCHAIKLCTHATKSRDKNRRCDTGLNVWSPFFG